MSTRFATGCRAVVEAGHSVLFVSATALLAALTRAETDGQLADRLMFFSKPKLLIIDELGYSPFERRSAPVCRRFLATRSSVQPSWAGAYGCTKRDSAAPRLP